MAGKSVRKSLQTANRGEAERRLAVMLKEISPYHGSIRKRFDDVADEYIEDAAHNLKPKTLRRYKSSILMLAEQFAGWWLDSITKDALLEYIANRKADGAKIPTIQRDLTAASQMFEFAIERDWADTNPVTLLPKRPLRYKTPVFHRPDARSVDAGIEGAYGNMRPLAAFLKATGIRLDEGVTLEWPQIDLRRKVATLTETKNGTARTVELNDAAMSLLKAQPHAIDTDVIFPAKDRFTGQHAAYKGASTLWFECQRKLAAKHKWFQRFRVHDLRHIYAIDYLASGGNIYLLQKQLGHGSIRQTEWYLQFLSPEEQMQAKFGPSQKASHPKRFTIAKGDENG